jgi:hypothetical protein
MAQYTREEIIDILVKAGVPNKDIPIMVAIALAESKGDSDAIGDKDRVNSKWDESIGLFQIRSLKNPNDPKFNEADKLRIKDKLFDPVYNAKAAYEISKKGKTWKDWTTFNEGTYKEFMSTGPSRSNIRLAGGGIKGRSKPITMAEETVNVTEENQDQFIAPTIAQVGRGGSALLVPEAQRKAISQLNVERKKLKDLEEDFQLFKPEFATQAKIDAQKEKVRIAEEKAVSVREKVQEVTGKKKREEAKADNIADADVQIRRLEEQLRSVKTSGKMPAVPGQKGPSSPLTRKFVEDLEAKVENLKTQRQNLLNNVEAQAIQNEASTTEPTVPVAGSGGTAVKDTGTVLGEVMSDLAVGDGSTVNIGPIAGVEKVIRGRYGQPVRLRPTETGVIDTEAAIGRINVLGPEGQKLKEQIRQVIIQNGGSNPDDATIQKYWTSAVKNTAAANQTDPNQTAFDTLAYMVKGGTGGDGTGPSSKEIKSKREAVKLLATQLGVVLTDAQVNDLGYQYAAGELDATTINPRIAKIGNIDFAMGEAANTISKLKSTAADFGVSYGPDWFTQSAKDVLTGVADADTLTQAIKDLAKSRYPTLAKQIDAGYTVKQIASPYLQSMANTLEINPNDISLDDPTIKQAFTSLNAEGQPITKPLWEFEKELRRDERWRYTKNAQQDLMGTARKVLSDFGLVY